MKTLIVAEQLRRKVPGGIGTYITGLLQGLQGQDDQHPGLWASRKITTSDVLASYGLPVIASRLPSKFMTRAWDRDMGGVPRDWDLIHATSTLVPPKDSRPLTATVHDLGWRAFPDAYPLRGRVWHEQSLLRTMERADAIVTPSQQTATALVDNGLDRKTVKVIPLGCDHLPEPDGRSALEKLNNAQVFGDFILAVGTLEPRKNLTRLVAAFERVREELDELELVIVGPEGWGEQLSPKVGVHIISSATMAEITALYDRCKAFVNVPLLEGFGLPVLEAMTRHAPVISSAVPSAGGATYRVDPTNVAAIAEAIIRVVEEEPLRRNLVRLGDEHCANYTWARCAEAHVELWDSLV